MNIWDLWWRCSSPITPCLGLYEYLSNPLLEFLIDSLSLYYEHKKLELNETWERDNLFFSFFLEKAPKDKDNLFFFKKKSPKEDTDSLFGRKLPLIFFPLYSPFFPRKFVVTTSHNVCLSTSYYSNGPLQKHTV
jgi:hypothetical protein